MRVYVDIFIILSVPPLIVNIQQILVISRLDHQLNSSLAPNILGVASINFIARLYRFNLMAVYPLLVLLHPLLPPLKLFDVAFIFTAHHNHLDRVVDHKTLLKNLPPDVLPALRTLLLSDNTFVYALMTEGMTTDCYSTTDNEIHTNRTS